MTECCYNSNTIVLIYNMRYKTPCELENDPGAKEMKEGKIYPE
jgi:hypothetical protein